MTNDAGLETAVKNFYGDIKFPGPYTIDDLKCYDEFVVNPYIKLYVQAGRNRSRILDLGCGTGFLAHLLARHYPNSQVDALDFSSSIEYAKKFGDDNNIKNVTYHNTNFFDFDPGYKYDLIVSNGVVHHMPRYGSAVQRIEDLLVDSGDAVIGIYNRYGKIAKRFFSLQYRSALLYQDQEQAPFETTFSNHEFMSLFKRFQLRKVYPSLCNHGVDVCNLLNYNNGGLTVYHLNKKEIQ
jgi:trans-aconitate methyltransferase